MVVPAYRIEPDCSRESLVVTMTGDWTAEIAFQYLADLGHVVREMMAGGRVRNGHLMTLVDMTRKAVLPQDVAAILALAVRADSPSRRIAFLVRGAIHRMQARRMATDPRIRIFEDEEAAVAWLKEGHEQRPAGA